MNEALWNQRKPARSQSMARVANTAVNIETITPTASVKAKPLTAAGAGDEQHRRRDQRDHVGVDDGAGSPSQ